MIKTVKRVFVSFVILFIWGLVACQNTAVPALLLPTTLPTAVPLPTAELLPTSPPPPLPTLIPTATAVPTTPATPFPTPTPRPVLTMAVLPGWEAAAQQAITSYEDTFDQPWQLVVHEQAADLLANGQAHLALSTDFGREIVVQYPIALTVPFTTEWEQTTLADANDIIANGHPLVTVQRWIDMSPTQKALRVDGHSPADSNYPLQERYFLAAASGYESHIQWMGRFLATYAPDRTQSIQIVHLAAVGDIMLDRALGNAIRQGALTYPFDHVADVLKTADLTIGNLESALGDVGTPEIKSFPFRAPPEAATTLSLAGFDIVSLANNHGMDYGPEALLQAISLLRARNVTPIGAGANSDEAHTLVIRQVNGLKLGFLAYVNVPVEATGFDTASWTATADSPGLAWGSPAAITADVTAARDQVDLVIVVLHSGFEYIEEPSEPQMAAAHAAIDAGADLVIGHHTHLLQGIEFYKEGVIVYGLGNFAFEIEESPETAVLNIWLDQDGVHELELIPAIIQFGGQPRLAEPWEAASIRRQVYFLTTILNAQ